EEGRNTAVSGPTDSFSPFGPCKVMREKKRFNGKKRRRLPCNYRGSLSFIRPSVHAAPPYAVFAAFSSARRTLLQVSIFRPLLAADLRLRDGSSTNVYHPFCHHRLGS
ncbi:unnamed protein product, partial [Sphacelaria rigidula]